MPRTSRRRDTRFIGFFREAGNQACSDRCIAVPAFRDIELGQLEASARTHGSTGVSAACTESPRWPPPCGGSSVAQTGNAGCGCHSASDGNGKLVLLIRRTVSPARRYPSGATAPTPLGSVLSVRAENVNV
jgi:hypothetical protein